jgi:UDP-glucose 4-epimerase
VRIAVTGATGNLGSALLRRLADSHAIVGLARRLPEPGFGGERTTWVAVDLTEDDSAPALREAFAGADAVVHLAWGFQPSHDLDYLEELGVGGTRRVLEAVTAVGVPHLVHLSSMGAYAPKEDDAPVDESWPTTGVPTSPYSRHKSAAERLLDAHEASGAATLVTRLRPGLVGQRSAASGLLRYGVPGWVPAKALDLVWVLPLDRGLRIPVVHADDVAAAIEQVLLRRPGGAFNLAAEPPITTERIAEALGARPVHVPGPLVRAAVATSWRLHLQQVDPGWLDLAFSLPLLDSGRAARELDWAPTKDAVTVLQEVVQGMRDTASDGSPVLRLRTPLRQALAALRRGPLSERERP